MKHVRLSRSATASLAVTLLLGPACTGADSSAEDDLLAGEPVAQAAHELGFTPRGDNPITSLTTGRLTKVPATEPYWFDFDFTPGSASTSISFRTTQCDALDDTVLLVRWTDPATGKAIAKFNDDAPAAQTDTLTSKNSFLNTGALGTTQPITFKITVASRKQTTARCQLQVNQNGIFSNLGTAKHVVGGLLVDVGALQQNDFVEVQTRKDGTLGWYIDRTNLMLFDIGVTAGVEDNRTATYTNRYTPYYAYGQDSENDPKITISGQDRSDARSYVILGKVGSGTTENRNVLYWVDLLHGPFRKSMRRAPWLNAGTSGGTTDWVVLTPGRYLAAVQAKVAMAIGDCSPSGTEPLCQVQGGIKRGRLNDRAFSYKLQRNLQGPDGTTAETLQTREVPLGAFGMKDTFHRFYLEFDVPVTGHYRFTASPIAYDVSFEPAAGVEVVRNLAATEMKVASTNVYYWDNGGPPNSTAANASGELENAAHLLMLRGAIDRSGKRVTQKPADAIEMQADVVAMTEVAGEDNFHRTRDEANTSGSLRWNYKVTVDEDMFGSSNGWGGIFVNDHFWPDYDNENSIIRPGFSSSTFHCESSSNGCSIYEGGDFGTDLDAVPVKMVMDRRGDSTNNIPIVVVESHFTTAGPPSRKDNASVTADMLALLQGKEPLAFNRNGSTSPADPDTRIIVVGDLNMESQDGEAYQIIAALRTQYGFAIDAAQAVSAMGIGAAAPTGGSIYGNYGGYNYSSSINNNAPYLPAPYEDFFHWDALSEPIKFLVPFVNHGPAGNQGTFFPWWAASWHTGRNRLDGVMLVGRGWLKDDAVRDYLVTQINPDYTQGDADRANPFRVYTEDGQPIATCLKPMEDDVVRNPCNIGAPYVGYQPPFVPFGQGAAGLPGDMPMNTDHKPIMARVRAIGDVLAEADRLYFKRQKRYGNAGSSQNPQKGQDVAYDAAGNKYLIGTFGANGMAAMGGACTTALTYAGGTGSDMYVAKIDAQNACVWQKRIGGTGDDRAWSLALDASGGVYVSGGFAGTVDFNPGSGTNNFTAVGGSDAFLTKLDSAGGWVWTKTVGDAGTDFGSGVTVDGIGKIWWAGYFNWASTVARPVGACTVTGTGTGDSFWASFDAAGTAATTPGGCGALTGPGNQYVYAIGAASPGTDVVLAGMYDTAFTAGTKPVAAPVGGYDIFTYGLQGPAKNNVAFFGSAGWDQANSITVDYSNYYVGGFVSGSVSNFGGNCAASGVGGGQDGLVVKLFDNGACLWTSRVGGAAADWVQDVVFTPNGVVALGTYQSASVVAGARTHTLSPTAYDNALLYTLDPVNGAVLASRSFEYVVSSAAVPLEGRGLAMWSQGGLTRVAATGYFFGQLDTGAGPFAKLDANADFNVFVSEYENP